jgi:quinol monooxygenase YgiN
MPIIVAGEVDMAPGTRDAALAGARALIEQALAEPGCRHYAWTADPVLPDRVHVFEEWESAETLAAHLVAPSYFGMLAHLSGFGIAAAVTRKYRCDLVEPVYGANGVATASFAGAGS